MDKKDAVARQQELIAEADSCDRRAASSIRMSDGERNELRTVANKARREAQRIADLIRIAFRY